MADNINVFERNTLPVLYNINVSTVILPPRQHYISIYLYIYLYFRNTEAIQRAQNENNIGAAKTYKYTLSYAIIFKNEINNKGYRIGCKS